MNSFLLSIPGDVMATICLLLALASLAGMVWLCASGVDDDMQITTDNHNELLKFHPLKGRDQ